MKLFNCILGIIVVCSIFSCSKYYRKMVCDEGHYYGETLNGVRSGCPSAFPLQSGPVQRLLLQSQR